MTQVPAGHSRLRTSSALHGLKYLASLALLFVMLLFASLSSGQSAPKIISADPATGKVNDSITLAGANLGKGSVGGVFLSDDNNDYKAALVDQSAEKIVFKVPQVKAGNYHVSIQVGTQVFIEPVRFTVQ